MSNEKIRDIPQSLGIKDESDDSKSSLSNPISGAQPNVLFILVDEMRFPSVLPAGINSTNEFVER